MDELNLAAVLWKKPFAGAYGKRTCLMSPNAALATQKSAAHASTPATQNCRSVPATKVHHLALHSAVSATHACHTKEKWLFPSAAEKDRELMKPDACHTKRRRRPRHATPVNVARAVPATRGGAALRRLKRSAVRATENGAAKTHAECRHEQGFCCETSSRQQRDHAQESNTRA